MKKISCGFFILLILSVLVFATSCIPQKKLRYLESGNDTLRCDSCRSVVPVHSISPHDMLHIQIVSMAAETSKVPGFDAGTNVGTQASVYLQAYPVEEDGELKLPVLGSFLVTGMTIAELEKQLTLVAREKVSLDAEVFVRLLNFKISILGEVKSPGIVEIYDEKVSILDALAMAGDMTTYGDREKVMLVRNNNGVQEIHYINLTRKDLLTSPYFYLRSQDVIYVSPMNAKSYGFGQVQWGIIFSTLSTVIAILAIVIK
jgi:polysaccharide biosynthesis/export protein